MPAIRTTETCLPSYGGPVVRHLAFHLWPVAGNGVWQAHVAALKARAHLFNGRKIVAVAESREADPAWAVAEALGSGWEILPLRNSVWLREVASWEPLLSRLESTAPNEIFLYGQGKGAHHPATAGAPHLWASLMRSACLDRIDLVEQHLLRYPITGAFKKVGRQFVGCPWHYSGSWFWARSCAFFGRPWRQIERKWYGVESSPGRWFDVAEAGCLFFEATAAEMDLYQMTYLREKVLPAWRTWCAEGGLGGHPAD